MKNEFPERAKLPVLAIVVPCFNEEKALPPAVQTLLSILDELIQERSIDNESFLYFIDDGSSDGSWQWLIATHQAASRVRGLKLSKNFGHQNALMAGLMAVKNRCDISISIDADLQQDPRSIREFVQAYLAGADVVFGVRKDRNSDGVFKRTTALAFYRLMSMLGVTTIKNHADYRLLSRKALEALSAYTEPALFLRAISVQLGFKSAIVYFDVKERSIGESKYTIGKMLSLAVHGVTSFSVAPLRLIALTGLLIFSATILMSAYILVRALFVGDTVPGWASTTLPIYFLGGIQILCMGIIGEYLAQTLNTVKQRPRYIVEGELF